MRVVVALALAGGLAPSGDSARDLSSLVAIMEALQAPVKDFRCEFEGEDIYKGERAEVEAAKLGPDGLAEIFGCVFIWQRDGDRRSDLFRRREFDNHIEWKTTIIHMRDKKIEFSYRANNASLGHVEIEPLTMSRANSSGYFGEIFPIDQIKDLVGNDFRETTVVDDQIDGRPLKLLTVHLKLEKRPNMLLRRYWIDPARSGQVVRIEVYHQGSMSSRWDISLKSFRVGGTEVWMPVSGELKNYAVGQRAAEKAPVTERAAAALRLTKPGKEPTMLRSIRVIAGTMEFNKKPSPSMFTLKHKLGTPVSDKVRKLNYHFGQKQISNRLSKAEAETMLQEQIAEAEEQRRELVAVPPRGDRLVDLERGRIGRHIVGLSGGSLAPAPAPLTSIREAPNDERQREGGLDRLGPGRPFGDQHEGARRRS